MKFNMNNEENISLFGGDPEVSLQDQEWLDMPEFIQNKKEPFAKIIIRVESQQDLDELAERISQPLTPKTKSAWFPFKSHFRECKQPEWSSDES